jgi:hypothetical protein
MVTFSSDFAGVNVPREVHVLDELPEGPTGTILETESRAR